MPKPTQDPQTILQTVQARLAEEDAKRAAEVKRLDDAKRILVEHANWKEAVEKAGERLTTAKHIFGSTFNAETLEKAFRDFGGAASFGNPAQMHQAALNIAAHRIAIEHRDRFLAEMGRATVGQAASALAHFEAENAAVLKEFGAVE